MASQPSLWDRASSGPVYPHASFIVTKNLLMKLQLINGHFSPQDALDILTKLTQVKVGYHELQIKASDNEEDVKAREKRIKTLQHNLQQARQTIAESGQRRISLQADITITIN